MTILTELQWDKFLENYPESHILQSSSWGKLKAEYGWDIVRVANYDAGAQILFKRLPLGYTIAYIPKGPIGENFEELFAEIEIICRERKTIFLKVEPDDICTESTGFFAADSVFKNSASVQPRRSIIVDLSGDEQDWLDRMKQKTRYNIRLAEKKGISIIESDDVNAFYQLMITTGQRDKFGIHSSSYYKSAYDLFSQDGRCVLIFAVFESKLLAGLMAFKSGERAWYFYGASTDEERQRMPTYLLQWETMRWAGQKGCKSYDLWGVPDYDEEFLESHFSERGDDLWGVYRFKRGFGGRLVRSVGAWDKAYKSTFYKLYMLKMSGREL